MQSRSPAAVGVVAALLALGAARPATAQEGPPPDARAAPLLDALDEEADAEPAGTGSPWPTLDPHPKWAAGLEGYAGIAAQWTSGPDRAHGLVGGLARVRFSFFQAGGTFEATDSGEASSLGEPVQEHWRAVGGFVGAWLPYSHWIDVDAAVGLSSRTYANPDTIYGPAGFEQSTTALTLRAGVSDRTTRRLLGARIGAAIVGSVDLSRSAPPWRRQFLLPNDQIGESRGTTDIGGVAIGLVVCAGFEVGGGGA